jgi:hypothetical protein
MTASRWKLASLPILLAVLAAAAPAPAYASNCSDLTDCWDSVAAAVLVAVALAALLAIGLWALPALGALLADTAGALTLGGIEAAAEAAGFSSAEAGVIAEAESILTSAEMGEITAAAESGESIAVDIGGRAIQYEPGMPASGLTNFEGNGFVLGREAFTSDAELAKTVLHELYRLATSSVPEAGADAATVAAETEAAASFAERAYQVMQPFLP